MEQRPDEDQRQRRVDDEGPAPYTDPREPGFVNATFKTSWMFFTVILLVVVAAAVILWAVV